MNKEHTSIRTLAIIYLCLYAIFYPLATHFLMADEETNGMGSAPIQAFQGLTLLALILVGKFGRDSLRNCVDVWTTASVYFAGAAWCFAETYSENQKIVELGYAARFISWFLFATIAARGSFEHSKLKILAVSFWCGALIQCALAILAYANRSTESIYREVYATTGGAYVSGKMIVAFVTLCMLLSIYWFFTQRRARPLFLLAGFGCFFVVLASFNRASQLGLVLVSCWAIAWLFNTGRIKSAAFFVVLLTAIGVIIATLGESFLARWQNIQFDGGSGRIKLVRAALTAVMEPESLNVLFFGQGYGRTKELMFQACGAYIGTHSDLLDFLTAYGLVGLAFYFLIVLKIFSLRSGVDRRTPEYFCLRFASLFVVIVGLFTGMFQGTYAYFMFLTLCAYWRSRAAIRIEERNARFPTLDEALGVPASATPVPFSEPICYRDDFSSGSDKWIDSEEQFERRRPPLSPTNFFPKNASKREGVEVAKPFDAAQAFAETERDDFKKRCEESSSNPSDAPSDNCETSVNDNEDGAKKDISVYDAWKAATTSNKEQNGEQSSKEEYAWNIDFFFEPPR